MIVRWDRAGGGKDIRPVARNEAGWTLDGMPTPRPLYGLPELTDAERVYVTEGEPAADALRSVAAGVALSRWFGCEARRVYAVLAESDDDRDRRRLVELIERKGGTVTVRDLMRSSRMFGTAPEAEAALDGPGHGRHGKLGTMPGRPTRR